MEWYILKYLEDKAILSRGSNAWVNFQPDLTSVHTTIFSESAPQTIDSHHYDTDLIGIQFITKSTAQQEAYNLAWDIHRMLSGLGYYTAGATLPDGTVLPDIRIIDTHIVNAPTFLSVDEKGRVEFTSHYMIRANMGNNEYRKMNETLTPTQ